ncbi:dTDP-4-dehydrorhamnose reductase [Stutzerimonas tarimensis]|uniref:dTDP-4-dehydrorhamnose reductase n=1 Tax=Stutzerimonas tarimensis TaxID=1507735 RepID=A0ABV7TAV0_9GAMM
MRILITGSHGQLSRELQLELAGDGQIVVLGSQELNLLYPDRIRQQVRQLKPDLIINAAAYTAVDKAESEVEQAIAINGHAPGILAEEARRLGVPLIHYSTDYVFDGNKRTPYCEDDQPSPLSVYGSSKLAGERAIQAVGGQGLILRTSWVYSLHGRNFLLTMRRLMQERKHLTVVDDEIGAPTWAGTIASVTASMIRTWRREGRPLSGLYHLTAAGYTSWYGFASLIGKTLDQQLGPLDLELGPIASADYPTAARRPLNSRLNCDKLQREWGVQLPEWEVGLALCLGTPRDNGSSLFSGMTCSA